MLLSARRVGVRAGASFRRSVPLRHGDGVLMLANPLVGTITTRALLLLFWPLTTRLLGLVWRPKKRDPILAEQPVD